MAQTVQEVMTTNLVTLDRASSVVEAAQAMRDHDIGDVVVVDDGELLGMVTDRDIVVRGIADSSLPVDELTVEAVCSPVLTAMSENDTIEAAAAVMREQALRRLPIVEGRQPVGIVSLGDLAVERDEASVLGTISAAPANS